MRSREAGPWTTVSEVPGLVPWVGDLWIGYYKVNARNVATIERALLEHMIEKGIIEVE